MCYKAILGNDGISKSVSDCDENKQISDKLLIITLMH